MKRRTCLFVVFGLAGLGVTRDASAQNIFSPQGVGYMAAFSGWPYNWGGGAGGFGGGTAQGNYLMGLSATIAAEGAYNEALSRSYVNYEEARKKYIENRQRWTDTHFAMRELNESNRRQRLERAKHSPETLATAARLERPRPLSSDAIDPATGRLRWPEVLKARQYAPLRSRLDELLDTYVSTGSGNSDAMQQATREAIALLKADVHTLPTGEYVEARRFLDGLTGTARVADARDPSERTRLSARPQKHQATIAATGFSPAP